MKVIKTVFYLIVVVVGIWIMSANMQGIQFVYMPEIPFSNLGAERSIPIPVSFLVLASVVLGAVIAGTGTLIEHARLRAGVRKQTKRNDKLAKELTAVRGELEQATHRQQEAAERTAEAEAKASTARIEAEDAGVKVQQAEARAIEAEAHVAEGDS